MLKTAPSVSIPVCRLLQHLLKEHISYEYICGVSPFRDLKNIVFECAPHSVGTAELITFLLTAEAEVDHTVQLTFMRGLSVLMYNFFILFDIG